MGGIWKHRKWLIMAAAVAAVVFVAYAKRLTLERLAIACRLYRAQIFTPPTGGAFDSRWARVPEEAQFYWDFAGFMLGRRERVRHFSPILKPLVKEIARRQAAGQGMQYSMHIYRDIRWRMNFTPDTAGTAERIEDLRRSLTDPAQQSLATQQQPYDGSWGMGMEPWYLRLYYSVEDGLDVPARPTPEYRFAFLDRINSPEKLAAQLNSDLYDDFTRTGVFNREELDETFSAIARLLFRMKPIGYEFDPELRNALRQFVERWQNPATGCWGQWLVDRQGKVWKMDDAAMTFHVVSDLGGQVDHLDLIATRLLQLEGTEFPAGIRFNGHYENHLNWDAVKIFRYAWPSLNEATRQQARREIGKMQDWCLSKSYQQDGSFKVSDLDDTVGDAYFYGVLFLRETGYFQREKRFWTDQEFPEAKKVREQIRSKIESVGVNELELKEAYEALGPAQ